VKRDGSKYKTTKKMDSPLERPCPLCPGSIEGDDPHCRCIECLGSDHVAANLGPLAVCSACQLIPRPGRHQRLAQFEGFYVSPVEDPELNLVEMEDLEEGVPFVYAIPADRAGPSVGERDNDYNTSSSGISGDRQESQQHGDGDDYGGGECRLAAPPTVATEAGEPPASGLLQPGLRFTPPARHLAVCGDHVAAATENEGSGGYLGWNPQSGGPLGHGGPEDGSDYSDRCVGQMNNLVHGMRVMALTTVASRHVWLGLTALTRKDRDDLLGAPVTTEGLFWLALRSLRKRESARRW